MTNSAGDSREIGWKRELTENSCFIRGVRLHVAEMHRHSETWSATQRPGAQCFTNCRSACITCKMLTMSDMLLPRWFLVVVPQGHLFSSHCTVTFWFKILSMNNCLATTLILSLSLSSPSPLSLSLSLSVSPETHIY